MRFDDNIFESFSLNNLKNHLKLHEVRHMRK